MMSKILIITGGSKGIGKGIIEAYLADDFQVFSIARSVNNDLKKVTQLSYDLSKTDGIKKLISELFEKINPNEVEKITLVNNAGTLGEIGRIEDIADIETTVMLNTVAPLLIVSSFISLTKNWKAKKAGVADRNAHLWQINAQQIGIPAQLSQTSTIATPTIFSAQASRTRGAPAQIKAHSARRNKNVPSAGPNSTVMPKKPMARPRWRAPARSIFMMTAADQQSP